MVGAGDRALGFSALGDQQTAGAIMLVVDIVLMVSAMAFLFWRAAAEADRRSGGYSTVSVPSMPPSRWPGTEQ